MAGDEYISIEEAAEISGVDVETLEDWVRRRVLRVRRHNWTRAAAAQARVVARMRERGHSLDELRKAVSDGRLAFGFVEELLPGRERSRTLADAAESAGLEAELVERIQVMLGTPSELSTTLTDEDVEAMKLVAGTLEDGMPLVAVLQLVRVYAQSIRKIAEAEVRLFHLFVHEPMIRDGVGAAEIATQMEGMVSSLLPATAPLMRYVHERYLRFYLEQDVVGHMETDFAGDLETGLGHVQMTFCFIDLTGFTRYTEEEGDEEAIGLIERFVETVESTLPSEALIVKTIGDEVMVVSPDASMLTEWAVGFLTLFSERPKPRVGLHHGRAVYRDGDYFGTEVNLAHRIVNRALAGEVMVTESILEATHGVDYLEFEPIGAVELKGFPAPVELFTAVSKATGPE
ncbi:MerR family transcriptional regulator [Thermoleophilia bacterium SCSIO 60948]|nr:MerR family transcriptional regulator [Thermoleophilia bacterium SCSIO 60948]